MLQSRLGNRGVCRALAGSLAITGCPTPPHHQLHTETKKDLSTATSNSRQPSEYALSTLVHDVRMYKTVGGDLIRQKWHQAYSFYEQFSHMDEVREAHDKVVYIQNELQLAQQRRTDLLHELNFVRKELQLLHGEMTNCDRNDYRYLELVRKQIEVNQREKEKLDAFNAEDQRERNLFTHLTAAVKASHEKEKIYANTVKYWSIIGSILGATLGVAGSALSYHYRQNSYMAITDRYTEQVVAIDQHIGTLRSELDALRHEIQAARVLQQNTLDFAVHQARASAAASRQQQSVAAIADGVVAGSESWTSFLYRKSVACYRWFWPTARETATMTTLATAK